MKISGEIAVILFFNIVCVVGDGGGATEVLGACAAKAQKVYVIVVVVV